MTEEMLRLIVKDPQSFLDEIIRSNGKDSTAYIWAVTVVKEVQYKIGLLRKEGK